MAQMTMVRRLRGTSSDRKRLVTNRRISPTIVLTISLPISRIFSEMPRTASAQTSPSDPTQNNPLGVYTLTPEKIRPLPEEEVTKRRQTAEAERREVPGVIRYAGAPGGDPRGRHPGHRDRDHEGSYAVGRIRLTIHHLYADMMNLYGDRGNVISIK